MFFRRIKALDKAYGSKVADVSKADYDQRTPLHIATSEGNKEIVEYLLKNGASVHVRDRSDTTPLMDAIREEHSDIIKILVNAGAHLHQGSLELGEKLCMLARMGEVKKLYCYKVSSTQGFHFYLEKHSI